MDGQHDREQRTDGADNRTHRPYGPDFPIAVVHHLGLFDDGLLRYGITVGHFLASNRQGIRTNAGFPGGYPRQPILNRAEIHPFNLLLNRYCP